jgi:hypothetical protein
VVWTYGGGFQLGNTARYPRQPMELRGISTDRQSCRVTQFTMVSSLLRRKTSWSFPLSKSVRYRYKIHGLTLSHFNCYRLNVFGFPGLPGVHGVAQNPGLEDQRLAVEWVRANTAGFGRNPSRITLFGVSISQVFNVNLLTIGLASLPGLLA